MTYELFIAHGNELFFPPIADGVTVEWERKGQPGKLTFQVVKSDSLSFEEGDTCRFSVDGTPMFFGFVFEKESSGSTSDIVKVTVYDQLYYLKNKDTYVYADKTASEVIKMIAEDFGLRVGALEDTSYKIKSRTEDNVQLFDIIQNALDETLKAKTEMYVLYDKVGRLTLTNISNMKLGIALCDETVGDYDYKSSIASSTYNRIKLVHEDSDEGTRRQYIAQDSGNINQWGVLQYYEKLNDGTVAQSMADGLLNLYNTKTRTLSIKNAIGDIRIRAGSLLPVFLELEDMSLSNFLMVEQVKHSFKDNEHLMELKLRGGTFVT